MEGSGRIESLSLNSNFLELHPHEDELLIPGLPNDMALECLVRVPSASHPTLRLVSHHWRSILSDPSFSFLRRRASAAEHLVFLIQPLSPPSSPRGVHEEELGWVDEKETVSQQSPLLYDLNVYNWSQQEWRNLAGITIPTLAQCVALPSLGKVVVLGGWDPATLEPVPRVLVVDLAMGTWREGSPMPTARSFFASAVVGEGTVYVAGGHDGQKNALRTAEAYDVETDQWRALPPMAEERDESQGLLLAADGSSKFWVISGYGTESQGRFRSDAEVYNPVTNTWSQVEGVWPYPGHTPKSTAVAMSQRRQRWWCMIGGEMKEFEMEEKAWKALNLGPIPKSVSDSSSISLVDIGEDRIMVMGNGGKCGGDECKEEGCGGPGAFMLESSDDKDGVTNWRWKHVHTPSPFLGFPFSASQLFM